MNILTLNHIEIKDGPVILLLICEFNFQLEQFTLQIPDPELAKLLDLSTEDLRFCEYLVAVTENATASMGMNSSENNI